MVMQNYRLNLRITAMGLFLLLFMTSCSSPRVFSFQDIQYYTSSSGQAQLGNLGLMSASDGFGFQRAAFLSDCQEQALAASVDATIQGMLPLRSAFGQGTKAKALSTLLGVPADNLDDYRVLLLSLNPLDAERAAANWPETCKAIVARDADRTRLIISVAALIPNTWFGSPIALPQLTAQISARGHLIINIHGKKMSQIKVSPQSIFAWRSGHFCWAQDDSLKEPILRADDSGFDTCPAGYGTSAPPGSLWASTIIQPVEPSNPSEAEVSASPESETVPPSAE
jgi:hypothetical protein